MKHLTHAEILKTLSPANRMRYVADYIDNLPDRRQFDMRTFRCSPEGVCGTIACLAGWTVLIGDPENAPEDSTEAFSWAEEAARLLGIEENSIAWDCLCLGQSYQPGIFWGVAAKPLDAFRALADKIEANPDMVKA